MKELGQPIFFIIWRFSLLRGTIEEYTNGALEKFIMRGFSLLGEFIIRGSAVLLYNWSLWAVTNTLRGSWLD